MNTNPDPKRPWKAVCAAVVAGLSVALAQGTDILPGWLLLVIAVVIGGLATFLVPNPAAQ